MRERLWRAAFRRIMGLADMRATCGSSHETASNLKLCQKLRRRPPTLADATDVRTQRFRRSPTPTDAHRRQKVAPKAGAGPDCATPRKSMYYNSLHKHSVVSDFQDCAKNCFTARPCESALHSTTTACATPRLPRRGEARGSREPSAHPCTLKLLEPGFPAGTAGNGIRR